MSNTPTIEQLLARMHAPGEVPKSYSICVYGRPGAGKTTLLSSLPGKGLVIDIPQVEGGTFVLGDHADRIKVIPIEEWNEIDPIYWHLKKDSPGYDWVAIDSITAMNELAVRRTVKERDISSDPHTISLQEWGKVGQFMSELIFRFRQLPVLTVWIAQEKKRDGVLGPDISPAAMTALNPSMMLIGHLRAETGADGTKERHLRIGQSNEYITKYRAKPSVEVPDLVKDPHLGKLLRWIFEGKGKAPEAATVPTNQNPFLIIE